MSDVNEIKEVQLNGVTHSIKDETARSNIERLNSANRALTNLELEEICK